MVYCVAPYHFTRRKLITIDGSMVTTQTDIPLGLNINLPNVQATGVDVRLVKLDGTEFAREIECKDVPNTDDVMIWYKWDTTVSQDDQFWVYWGNPNLTEPAEDATYGREAVWDSDFVGVYHMAQAPTGTLIDSTSYDNDGTSSGGMTSGDLLSEDYGKVIDFDGTDDKISIDGVISDLDLTLSADVTFEVRMKQGDNTNIQLMGLCTDSSWNDYLALSNYSGQIRAKTRSSGGVAPSAEATTAASTTVYQSFVNVKDGDDVYIYTNGIQEDSDTTTTLTGTINATSADIGWLFSNVHAWNVNVSEVRFSKILRSANWLLTTHKNHNNPTASGTVPFYKSFSAEQHQRRIPRIL